MNTPEYLIQESGLWDGTQESWQYLYTYAINILEQNPLATPEDFNHYINNYTL